MQFVNALFAAAALVPLVAANTVTFVSQDSTSRTIYFVPNAGLQSVDAITVPGGGSATTPDLPQGWVGNFYAVSDGSSNQAGMLGEVAFQAYGDTTYFDVSAIVNPNDNSGVHELYPSSAQSPVAGCASFPCSAAYYAPDDLDTMSTTETDFTCTLGGGGATRRSVSRIAERLRKANRAARAAEERKAKEKQQ